MALRRSVRFVRRFASLSAGYYMQYVHAVAINELARPGARSRSRLLRSQLASLLICSGAVVLKCILSVRRELHANSGIVVTTAV